jgi:hypothetical protein
MFSNDQGLNDSGGANRARQFFEGVLAEVRARLIWTRVNEIDIHLNVAFLGP